MFKHPKCGGQHETVSQARACEQGVQQPEINLNEMRQGVYESNTPEDVWPWAEPKKVERPAPKRFEDRPRTKGDLNKQGGFKPLGVAYAEALNAAKAKGQPLPVEPEFIAPQNHFQAAIASEWGAPTAPIETSACSGRNSETYRPTRKPGDATDKMVAFCRDLLTERDWEHAIRPESQNGETIALLAEGEYPTFASARLLIEFLKTLPKQAAPGAEAKPNKEQPWKTLSKEVPAGYYGITDENGKNHFYRVSVGRNGFFKIQEQASADLYFVPLARYAGILKSILDFGLDRAGKFYATETSRCRKCNRVLTDNTGNPYFDLGYGPDCGGK